MGEEQRCRRGLGERPFRALVWMVTEKFLLGNSHHNMEHKPSMTTPWTGKVGLCVSNGEESVTLHWKVGLLSTLWKSGWSSGSRYPQAERALERLTQAEDSSPPQITVPTNHYLVGGLGG